MALPKLSPEQRRLHDRAVAVIRIRRRRKALRLMWLRGRNR